MLSDTFSEVREDDQGRLYVVHKATGVVYYVKDEVLRRGRANGATVRTYTPTGGKHVIPRKPAPERPAAPKLPEPRRQQEFTLEPRRRDVLDALPWSDGNSGGTVLDRMPVRRREPVKQQEPRRRVHRARFIPGSEPR